MANEYLEKLRSVGFLSPGRQDVVRRWQHDGDSTMSYQTEHWDGREDVNIHAGGIRVTEEDLGYDKGELSGNRR